jgi:CDP-glucose 4,6-dehydratase
MQGHEVSGIALDPPKKSLFIDAELSNIFKHDFRIDIRVKSALREAIKKVNPDVIVHLAAQPLVRESYKFPVDTFETNVIGTLNVLEATKALKSLKATLIITTDKVYKNKNLFTGYIETDELGGDDPYSASKAAADLATQSWVKSFARSPVAIARSGNVIGGGDWAKDRIVADLVDAYSKNKIPVLRYPAAIRPWQHVLDCLNGYLKLIDFTIKTGQGSEWNFGPSEVKRYTVLHLVDIFSEAWGILDDNQRWKLEPTQQFHETGNLFLNSSKANETLGWSDKLKFEEAVRLTVEWFQSSEPPLEVTKKQINMYFELN